MPTGARDGLPTRFGFLLLPDLSLISLSAAIETLRMANRIAQTQVYSWRTISEDGAPVCASDGLSINVDCGIQDGDVLGQLDAVIVCGGLNVEDRTTGSITRWLISADKQHVALGATCTGSYVLAQAGLLDGYRCSVHWENIAALADEFPDVHVGRSIYTIDRNRFTSSGGTTPMDMMLYFVRKQCGSGVSAGVAEQFVYERIRSAMERQRIPLRYMIGNLAPKLVSAVELMEANVREPISQQELAEYVGLSRRQLQRLFHRYLLCTPSRYYLQLRLQKAHDLLQRSSMDLAEVSATTGFVSNSHFSKSYKEYFGYAPSLERRRETSDDDTQ